MVRIRSRCLDISFKSFSPSQHRILIHLCNNSLFTICQATEVVEEEEEWLYMKQTATVMVV